MGQITSGVGLISGLPIADIIDQLMALEARPKNLLEQRNTVLTAQQVAFQTINANLLAVQGNAASLKTDKVFDATKASSSNESVLTATSTTSAVPGSYSFRVQQLVSSQQSITKGFLDSDASFVGAATLTVERGEARLDSHTQLDDLLGGNGISRGYIRITDRSGATAAVDLGAAVTVNDVVDAINNSVSINVIATINGDGLTLTDVTGQTTSNLIVSDLGTSATATSLGIVGNTATNTITGTQINTIGNDTLLTKLNNANGVRTKSALADFRITDGSLATFDVNLDNVIDIGGVISAINAAATAASVSVTAALASDGVSIELTDAGGGGASFAVSALNSSLAASDLGILTNDADLDGVIGGDRVLAGINSKLIKFLNGGTGLSQASVLQSSTPLADLNNGAGVTLSGDIQTDIIVIDRTGAQYWLDLDTDTTVQDFINHVSTASGGNVTVSIEGNALRVTDNTGATASNLNVNIPSPTLLAAEDLGIRQSVAATTFLGTDIDPLPTSTPTVAGTIRINNMAGVQTDVDMTSARSVSDVIRLINNASAGVTIGLNNAGNGFKVTDTSGGTGSLVISDLTGTSAASFGLVATSTTGTVDGSNTQLQYITEATRLGDLNITMGKFLITDSTGQSATVDLTQGNEVTIGDVLDEINSRGLLINATINTNGDGIIIADTNTASPISLKIKVEESGSSTAADLGILGEATTAGGSIDGSYEKTITVSATDTLSDVSTLINNAGAGVTSSIINDGTSGAPYRLSLSSDKAGNGAAFIFDDGALDFGAFNLAEAQDAVVFFGGSDPANSMVITSKTNTLSSVIPGATIDLLTTSNNPVQVTISRDNDAITTALTGFVGSFNSLMDTFDQFDKYDAETEERGLLLGDSTVASVRSAMFNMVIGRNNDISGQFNSLAQVGITIGSGARLKFDQTKFLAALDTDRDAVEDLFTFKQTTTDSAGVETITAAGFGVKIDELLKRMTDTQFGPIQSRVDGLGKQIDLNDDRIAALEVLLEAKRQRLQAQFVAMERALASMQTQSSALASIQALQMPTSNSSSNNN